VKEMRIDECRQQIVRGGNGMEIAMKV